mmetsp:Transcript_13158/g.48832  ORF Transcript_13158/g.48832 Transcript_13158/m.48832 type:complete len:238 (+) Transcript_13158:1059-1772(+)
MTAGSTSYRMTASGLRRKRNSSPPPCMSSSIVTIAAPWSFTKHNAPSSPITSPDSFGRTPTDVSGASALPCVSFRSCSSAIAIAFMGSSCCRLAGSMLPTWPVPPAIRSDPSSLLHAGRPKLVLARCQSGALPAPSRDKGSKAAFSHFPSSAKRRICSGVRDAHKSPGSILLSPMLCSSLSDLRLFQSFFLEALPDFFVLFSEFPEVWNSRLALPLTCLMNLTNFLVIILLPPWLRY